MLQSSDIEGVLRFVPEAELPLPSPALLHKDWRVARETFTFASHALHLATVVGVC